MSPNAEARMDSAARGDEIRIGLGLSSMGFVLAGLGGCVAILARDLNEPTSRLALLSSGFAAAYWALDRSWTEPPVGGNASSCPNTVPVGLLVHCSTK